LTPETAQVWFAGRRCCLSSRCYLTEAALQQQARRWENTSHGGEGPGTDRTLNFSKAEIHPGRYLSIKDGLNLKSAAERRDCSRIYCISEPGLCLPGYKPAALSRSSRCWLTESQNHRIVGVGRDLCGSSNQSTISSAASTVFFKDGVGNVGLGRNQGCQGVGLVQDQLSLCVTREGAPGLRHRQLQEGEGSTDRIANHISFRDKLASLARGEMPSQSTKERG